MIQKYVFGNPFDTEAVVEKISPATGTPQYGTISLENGFHLSYEMDKNDIVYGLGEANRGINREVSSTSAIAVTTRTTLKTKIPFPGRTVFHRFRQRNLRAFPRLSGSHEVRHRLHPAGQVRNQLRGC